MEKKDNIIPDPQLISRLDYADTCKVNTIAFLPGCAKVKLIQLSPLQMLFHKATSHNEVDHSHERRYKP